MRTQVYAHHSHPVAAHFGADARADKETDVGRPVIPLTAPNAAHETSHHHPYREDYQNGVADLH